jgi:hypothetical protein
MKLLTIIDVRPQFIKATAFSFCLSQDFSKPICGTGKTGKFIIKTLLNFKRN